jgi:hypothetical protein
MSAFIVTPQTMNWCLHALDTSNAPCDELDCLGRDLYALNQRAVEARYGEEDPFPEFRITPCKPSKIQQLKSLHCLRYQCSEGDIPETSLLYARIEKRIHELESEIIHDLPEYDAAIWD